MTRWKIEEYMKTVARERERKILERLPATANPTGFEVEGRYYRGELCQLIFEGWLDERGVDYETLSNTRGRSDPGGDFRITPSSGRQLVIDVKSVPVTSFRLFVNAEEFKRRPRADFYVAVQPHDGEEWATIYGYFNGDEVAAMPITPGRHAANHEAPLSAAHGIESALAIWR